MTNKPILKIAISAGEVSGDQHAAKLVEALRSEYQNFELEIAGMGSQKLAEQGVNLLIDFEETGSVNGFNPLAISKVYQDLKKFKKFLTDWRPDILIVVDYPDFNLRAAKKAKKLGIKTVYFIPPKIWAWRENRIKTIKKYIDQILVIFPFEVDFYQERGYQNVSFVGHPFTTSISEESSHLHFKDRSGLLRSLQLVPSYPTIALLPGSRKSEIKKHVENLEEILLACKYEIKDLQVIIPLAKNSFHTFFAELENKYDWLRTCRADSQIVMKHVDAGILKSGTCTLEAAFIGLPFVCFYQGSPFEKWVVDRYVKVKEYSLVNIIKSGTVKELIQEEFNAENVGRELSKLFKDQSYREEMLNNFDDIKASLATANKSSAYDFAAESLAFKTDRKKLTKNSLPSKEKSNTDKQNISNLKRLIRYIKPYKTAFILSMLAMVVFGATDGVLPVIIKNFLDDVFTSKDTNMLTLLPLILVFLGVVRALSGFIQSYVMAQIGHNITRDIRNQLHNKLLELNPDFYSDNSSGSILSRFTSDVLLVKEFLTKSSSAIIRDSIRVIALVAAAIYLDPTLAAISLIAFPLAAYPIIIFGKRIRKHSKKGQDEIGSQSSLVQESVLGNKVIKLFNQEAKEQAKFEVDNQNLTKTFIKSEKYRALSNPINELLAIFAICGVILYGGHTVISGERSQGEFIAFLAAIFLMYDPFKKLSGVYNQMQQGLSGADRIFEIIDEKPVVVESSNPVNFPENTKIELKDVSFCYPNKNDNALDKISLTVNPGEKVALVGFSGSGKSTLVDLIPRFIDPDQGSVSIGGVNLRDLKLSDIRSRIAMVNQQTFLFNDTIFNNIAYGNSNATEDDVINAAKAANAHQFISQFPDGYNTFVGENGAKLSGGEKQRLAIARAVLKNSPIVILDEATAALDNQSENLVQSALEDLQKDKTAIIIAHRLSTIRNADRIVVMEKGKIIELGSHQELISKGGTYHELHELQFRNQETALS